MLFASMDKLFTSEDIQTSLSHSIVFIYCFARKGKGEKERYTHLNAEFLRIARRDKKASVINTEK